MIINSKNSGEMLMQAKNDGAVSLGRYKDKLFSAAILLDKILTAIEKNPGLPSSITTHIKSVQSDIGSLDGFADEIAASQNKAFAIYEYQNHQAREERDDAWRQMGELQAKLLGRCERKLAKCLAERRDIEKVQAYLFPEFNARAHGE
ncbi:MAG: hypothetical protein LBL52_03305 [Rickettsiales bacterium]|nr:hypothetical protein [Rickettsiales bacterium]